MDVNLTRLKIDPKFTENFENSLSEALKSSDIVALYEVLDISLALDRSGEEIDSVYMKILELTFDFLASKLSKAERFDLNSQKELLYARAVYEHALERWDSSDFKGAGELFTILSFMLDDERLKKSMLLSMGLCAKGESLDNFLQKYVDHDSLDQNSVFFDKLTPEADLFLNRESSLIERELAKIEKIARESK